MRRVISIFTIIFTVSYCSGQESITHRDADLIVSIDSIMNLNFPPNEPGAAIIITKEGKEFYKKGFGLANIEPNVQMTSDMIFRLGSLTKQFTAVCILLLEEQGKLNVKDDILKYLPDYPTHGVNITIEHLLTHTSGIPCFTKSLNILEIEQTKLTTREILALFQDKPLDFEPGERYSYSNSGYNVLGAIIESVSRITYEQFVEENIFQKLKMMHSFYDHPEEVVKNKIQGYDKRLSGYQLAPYMTMSAPFSAGGLRSTVGDLAIWNKAIQSGKIISKQKLSEAFAPFILNSGELSFYGYGWELKPFLEHKTYSHSGDIFGFSAGALYFPEKDIYIAILSNNTSSLRLFTSWKISSLLLGEAIEPNSKITLRDPEEYTGTYQHNNELYKITNGIHGLSLNPAFGQGKLLQMKKDVFYVDETIASYTFNRDSTGIVKSFTVRNLYFGDEWYTALRLIE